MADLDQLMLEDIDWRACTGYMYMQVFVMPPITPTPTLV
jgi:hypothetical protein